jgi:hypothetical protein
LKESLKEIGENTESSYDSLVVVILSGGMGYEPGQWLRIKKQALNVMDSQNHCWIQMKRGPLSACAMTAYSYICTKGLVSTL